ncbi:MAG: hypothetical protein FWC36_10715 [Spirochaetes bacterium]|nr:hypothetical protein [Spirochaetota bacterium]
MKVTLKQTEKLLAGEGQKFEQFAFSMLLTRLRERYAKDSSQATVESCTNEVNAFLEKYKSIMAEDYAIIQSL